ncbi:MAG: Dabb family protein [Candidatus Thiodiazotropha sp. (ex Epidulcina cf. delphinae)]|nr:Dabb family protein [Candidatus Thiodiazotropha sp. (ex Epidulcina cf. delphinae)]
MIKHIALFKLKDEANGRNKKENIERIAVNIHGLESAIKEIHSIEVAPIYIDADSPYPSYDLAVYAEFSSKEDYDIYFHHPIHQQAAAFAASVSDQVAAITYKETL